MIGKRFEMATRPDIFIEPINAAFVRLRAEPSICQELSDHYTFEIPNAQFMSKNFRYGRGKGTWDGKIRLYGKRDSSFPTGLIPNLIDDFAKTRNYSVKNISSDKLQPPTEDEIKSFVTSLNLHGNNGKKIECREDQLRAIYNAISQRRTLILSPTASGKSLISYCIARWYATKHKRTLGLIVVPRIQLVQQLFADWCAYSNRTLSEKDFHLIHGGKPPVALPGKTPMCYISTWQSIYKLPPEYFARFDYVIGDEAHEFKAKSLSHIMNSCINAHDRTGLTGTLDGTNTHKLVLEGLFGKVVRVISSRELMDRGHIAKLNPIKILLLKHTESDCKLLKRGEGTYEEELSYLISSEKRNRFISNLGLSLTGNSLILFQRVETHGKILYEMLMKTENLKKKIFFIHGGVDTDIREEVRRIVENEKDAVIVASYGTFSTGINIKNLHNVIFASPSKSRIRNLQSIGRGLRLGDDKSTATLYDIADDLRVTPKSATNYTYKHMEERLKVYIEEKFPYKIYNIELQETGSKLQW